MKNCIKNLSKNILLVLAFFISLSFLDAQENLIVTSKSGEYFYQQKKYSLYELESVLAEYPQSYVLFLNGDGKRTSSIFYGISSVASFGLGALSFGLRQKPENLFELVVLSGPNVALYGAGLLFIGTGTILGFVSIIKHISGKGQMQRAISVFNANESESTSFKSEIKLGLSNHGVGFTLSF